MAEKKTKIQGDAIDSTSNGDACVVPVEKVFIPRIRIQQVASAAGRTKAQISTLKGLALNKIGKISELEDTPSVRGMVSKVSHLLRILK